MTAAAAARLRLLERDVRLHLRRAGHGVAAVRELVDDAVVALAEAAPRPDAAPTPPVTALAPIFPEPAAEPASAPPAHAPAPCTPPPASGTRIRTAPRPAAPRPPPRPRVTLLGIARRARLWLYQQPGTPGSTGTEPAAIERACRAGLAFYDRRLGKYRLTRDGALAVDILLTPERRCT